MTSSERSPMVPRKMLMPFRSVRDLPPSRRKNSELSAGKANVTAIVVMLSEVKHLTIAILAQRSRHSEIFRFNQTDTVTCETVDSISLLGDDLHDEALLFCRSRCSDCSRSRGLR